MSAKVVFAAAIGYLKDHLVGEIKDRNLGAVEDMMCWVVSVPESHRKGKRLLLH